MSSMKKQQQYLIKFTYFWLVFLVKNITMHIITEGKEDLNVAVVLEVVVKLAEPDGVCLNLLKSIVHLCSVGIF